MFLIGRLRRGFTRASPFFLHLLMIVSVVVYTLIGAACIRALENAHIDELNRRGEQTHSRPRRAAAAFDAAALDFVLSGSELAAVAPTLRPCVQRAIRQLLTLADCSPDELRTISIAPIDDCYRYAQIDVNKSRAALAALTGGSDGGGGGFKAQLTSEEEAWTFHNSIVFAFTVITTIGYGHVAPVSTWGRAFCLVYGLIGMPLALLSIADLGMFINHAVSRLLEWMSAARLRFQKWRLEVAAILQSKARVSSFQRARRRRCASSSHTESSTQKPLDVDDDGGGGGDGDEAAAAVAHPEEAPSEGAERGASESAMLAVLFVVYLLGGSFALSLYEPEMDYLQAVYFNWVSLSTIGLGDIVPKNDKLVWLTFAYLAVGLALTSLFIDVASSILRKLHYFGRKLEKAGATEVWFGGRKMKLDALLRHLGDRLNVPIEDLKNLNVESFVADSLRIADGELKTLRTSPLPPPSVAPTESIDLNVTSADDDAAVFEGGSERKAPSTARPPSNSHLENLCISHRE